MPPKKDKSKQKQKQSQSQNVVVNVAYHTKRRGPSKRQQQPQAASTNNSKPIIQQPQQQLYQSIPYLGLQSANNAQLLNSIQTSLAALYSQHNKPLTSVPPTNGFQAPRLIPPAPPQSTVVHVHPAQAPAPTPPVVNVNTPAPVVNVQTPTQPPPVVNVHTPAPIVNVHTPARASSTRRTLLNNAPADANRAAPNTTPIAPPLSIVVPSTPEAEFIPVGEPAQRRRSAEYEDHNPSPALPPPPALIELLVKQYNLKTTKTGLVSQKSKEWNRLPQEVKDRILSLQQKPVKAKLIPGNDDAVMVDDANVQLVTKRKKAPAEKLEVDEDAEMEEYLDKSYKSSSIPKMMDSHKIHGHTEMKPQSQFQQKPFLGLLGPSNKVIPTAYDTDTDYGKDITSDIDGP